VEWTLLSAAVGVAVDVGVGVAVDVGVGVAVEAKTLVPHAALRMSKVI
jgi:hypothetical protein